MYSNPNIQSSVEIDMFQRQNAIFLSTSKNFFFATLAGEGFCMMTMLHINPLVCLLSVCVSTTHTHTHSSSSRGLVTHSGQDETCISAENQSTPSHRVVFALYFIYLFIFLIYCFVLINAAPSLHSLHSSFDHCCSLCMSPSPSLSWGGRAITDKCIACLLKREV